METRITSIIVVLMLLSVSAIAKPQGVFCRLTNLPHVYINTDGGVPIESKTEYVEATMHRVNADDEIETWRLQIRGRGNSTWNLDKKPYRLKLEKKDKLLGEGHAKAKSWTLLACHGDKTLIRHALTFCLAEWMDMEFCPAHEFVDLTLNGEYQGTYMMSDQVEVRTKRVEAEWLCEFDNFGEGNCFNLPMVQSCVRIHYPKADEITAEQQNEIKAYFAQVEKKIYTNPCRYEEAMDMKSLIDWYLASEISANYDCFHSTYCYKKANDDRLHWGPLWDYDIAYDNDNRWGDTRNMLMRKKALTGSKQWVQRLWREQTFQQAVEKRMSELIDKGLTSFMLRQVDSLSQVLEESQRLNYAKWPIDKMELRERVLLGSYGEYIDELKDFIVKHNEYLAVQFNYIPSSLSPAPASPSQGIYDLHGRRLNTVPKRGVYIKDGKKFVRQ